MNAEESIDFANIDVTARTEDEVIELLVPTSDLNSVLIGRNAETLRSLQYIISTTLRNRDAALTRVNVDIADYKKQRAEKIAIQAREWIEEVRRSGDSHIADLNAADRRVVHRVADEYDDIRTFSEGEGRDRRLIIVQKSS
jgi:spoIIIJ-associated protein